MSFYTLKRVKNIDLYLNSFKILDFVETIKVEPYAWHQTKIGKDDYWGVSLSINEKVDLDPYFLLEEYLFHKDLSDIWQTSAYSSGYHEQLKIEEGGMIKEWALAKKVQGEIQFNILNNYSPYKHKETLKRIENLTDLELLELSRLYRQKNIDHIYYSPQHNRCGGCTKWNALVDDRINFESVKGLVKNDFLKEINFQIFSTSENGVSESKKYTQTEFKAFLETEAKNN